MHTLDAAECVGKAQKSAGKRRIHSERGLLSPAELEAIISDPNRWVQDTIAELIVGTPRATLRRLRHEGRGPRYMKDGVSCRYKVSWLLEYIAERVVEPRDSQPREVA